MAESEHTEHIDFDARFANTFANQGAERLLNVDRESLLHAPKLIGARTHLLDLSTKNLRGSGRGGLARAVSI